MNKKGYWLEKNAIDSDNAENASCGIFFRKGKTRYLYRPIKSQF